MERDPRIAVEPVGLREPVAQLFPRRANARGVGSRGAFERIEREVASALPLPAEFAPRERRPRARVDMREFPRGDPVVRRQVHGDRLREAHVARFRREAKARAAVGDRQFALRDQRGKQRLARIGRALAGEPEGLRIRQRGVAVALAAVLHAIARELDVLARRRRVKGGEARPLAALAQRLQPIRRAAGPRAGSSASGRDRR